MHRRATSFGFLSVIGLAALFLVSGSLCAQQQRQASATLHIRVAVAPAVFTPSAAHPETSKLPVGGVEYEFGRSSSANITTSTKTVVVESRPGQPSRAAVLETTTIVPN